MIFDLDLDWVPLMLMWVAFMTVIGVYVIRIGLMIHEQRAIERHYRVRLALHRRRADAQRLHAAAAAETPSEPA